ncbi:MAG: SBBP repeat-containing protein, partial [Flavobacteriales bacterium]
MNRILSFLFFCILTHGMNAQPPELDWAQGFGGKEKDYARGIAIDHEGNVLCTGSFMGETDLD